MAFSATALISSSFMIIYFYCLDWFEKSLRIDIQILQYGQKINVLFGFSHTFVVGHDNNISIIPFLNLSVSFEAFWSTKSDITIAISK